MSQFEAFQQEFNDSSLSADALAERMGDVDHRIVDYARSCKNGALTTKGFVDSVKNSTLAAKAGQTALQGLAMAGNMLVMALASKAVAFAAEKINEFANASEIAAAKAAGFTDSVQNFHAGIAGGASEIAGLNAEYSELKKGVNGLGQNIGLSAEQYDRYKEIVGKISDLMPDLTARFNEQGEAIAFAKKGITDLGDEYETYLKRQAKNYLINGDENGNTFQDAIDSFGANSRHGFFENLKHTFKHAFGTAGIDDIPVDTLIETLSAMQNKTKDEIAAYLSDIDIGPDKQYLFTESNRAKAIAEDLLDINLSKLRAQSDEEFNQLQENIAAHIESLQNSNTVKMEAITSGLLTAAYSKDDFWAMDDGDRDNVAAILSSFTPDIWKEIGGSTQAEVEQFAGTVINAVSKNTGGFADAWNGLFQLDPDSLPVTEYVAQVNTFMDTLCGVLGIDDPEQKKQFIISLGFDVETDQAMINGVKQKIDAAIHGDRTSAGSGAVLMPKFKTDEQLKLEQWVETLTESDLTLIADGAIRFDENTTVESAQNALEAAKRAVRDTTPPSYTESLASIETLSDGLNQLERIYADIADKGTFDWGSILNNEGFKQTFGELGAAYDAFIKTVSSSPDNLQACQGAFDQLAATYIHNSGALDNLTESTKAATVAMLNQLGVSNAQEMVNAKLAVQKEILAQYGKTLTELTYADIAAIVTEGRVSGETAEYLKAMALEELAVNGVNVTTDSDVANILTIAQSAGISAIELKELEIALKSLDSYNPETPNINTGNRPRKQNEVRNIPKKQDGAAALLSGLPNMFRQSNGETPQNGNNPAQHKQNDEKTVQKKSAKSAAEILEGLREQMQTLNLSDFYAEFDGAAAGKAMETAANSAKDAADSAKDTAETIKETVAETFDFIETVIETFEKNLADIEEKAGSTAETFETRAAAYKEAQTAAAFGTELLQADYDKYMAKANAVGLDETLAQKVRGGDSGIWDYTDDAIKQQIKDYETWYKKAQDCQDKIEDLKKKQRELAQANIELLITQYEKFAAKLEHANTRIEKWIALKEAWGFSASIGNYTGINKNLQKQISYLLEEDRQLKELQKTVAKGSEAWYEYNERLAANAATLIDLKQQMAENAKAAASLSKATADKKAETYDAKNELYDAKSDNAVSAKSKNKYINKKMANIDRTQAAYDAAVAADSKNQKASAKTLSNFKTTKENKRILASIKKCVKDGKRIPQKLLDQASKLADSGKLYNACVQYNAYYDAKESDKTAADLYRETAKQEKADLAVEKFNNIAADYDHRIAANEQKKTRINNQIALKREQGETITTADYGKLISAETAEQNRHIEKRSKLQKELNAAVADGSIKKGSEEWYAMVDAINAETNAIDQSKQALAEYKNEQRQIRWDAFDNAMETVKRTDSEADYYINRMSHKDLVDRETGSFTKYGAATLALHRENYESNLAQAAAYQKEYDNLMAQIEKGELSVSDEAVIQRLRDLQDAHRDAALSAEDELESVKDLARQGYDAQLTALGKLIDRYKELKNSAADAYGYQKQVADKVKTIAALQKQLTVLKIGGTEETRAQIQQLKVQLQDAKEDLRDTQYEKYVSDAEEMLDDLLADYEEYIDEKLNDTNDILGEISGLLGDEGAIIATLKELDGNLTQNLAALINGDTTAEKQTGDTVEKEKKEADKPAGTAQKPAAETGKRAAETTMKTPAQKPAAETGKRAAQTVAKGSTQKPMAETAKPAVETGKRAAKTALTTPTEKSVSEKVAAYLNAASEEEAQALVRSGEALAVDENIRQLLERASQTPIILETPDVIKNGFPQLPSPPAFLENLGDNIRVEIGDIVMNGVNDAETFGRQLREEICKNGKTTQCIAEAVSAKQLGRGIGSARLHR